MRRWASLGLCLLGVSACSETPVRDVQTRILCVLDSAPGTFLEHAPQLSAWLDEAAGEGRCVVLEPASTPSMSAAFAEVLTGEPPSANGLHSIAELGAQVLRDDVPTRAQQLSAASVTLASVSQAHFGLLGLDRGVQTWKAPAPGEGRAVWSASEVWSAIRSPLEQALAGDAPVFLVLHFSDLRGDSWRNAVPSRDAIDRGLAQWIGTGGAIDAAYADVESEFPLPQRLATALLRRKGDARRAAYEEVLRNTRLAEIDSVLGELATLLKKHGRLGAANLEIATGPNPAVTALAGQSVEVRGNGEYADLRSRLWIGSEAQTSDASGIFSFPKRGAGFLLRLDHPRLFALGTADIALGSSSLANSDVPALIAQQSKPWPENSIVGPVLDLQNAGGRRLSVRVDVPPVAEVELLLESFPLDPNWLRDFALAGAEVQPHRLRPGAVWIRWRGPLEFDLPPATPAARLGLVLRIDGQRVHGSRMRYLKRTVAAADSLTLGFSAGCWLEPSLRETGSEQPGAAIRLQLHDELPLSGSIVLPSAAVLDDLRRLNEDE